MKLISTDISPLCFDRCWLSTLPILPQFNSHNTGRNFVIYGQWSPEGVTNLDKWWRLDLNPRTTWLLKLLPFPWSHLREKGIKHLRQVQKAFKILNPVSLKISVQDLANILLGEWIMWQQWGMIFRVSWSQLLVTPYHAYVFPIFLIILLSSFPFLTNFSFCFSLLISYSSLCIYYLMNIKSLLVSGFVPALESRDEQHQQNNVSWEFMMGLECSQSYLILFNPHNTPRQALLSPLYTQGADRFKCPVQAYTNNKW